MRIVLDVSDGLKALLGRGFVPSLSAVDAAPAAAEVDRAPTDDEAAKLARLRPFMVERARAAGEIKKSPAGWWRGVVRNLLRFPGALDEAMAELDEAEAHEAKTVAKRVSGSKAKRAADEKAAKSAGMTLEDYRRSVRGF